MKKIVRSICIGVLLCVLCSIPTFAFGVDQSVLLLNGVNEQTVVKPQPRGSVISTGTLRISNEGEGAIGVFMQTLAHMGFFLIDGLQARRDGQMLNIILLHLLKKIIQMRIWQ